MTRLIWPDWCHSPPFLEVDFLLFVETREWEGDLQIQKNEATSYMTRTYRDFFQVWEYLRIVYSLPLFLELITQWSFPTNRAVKPWNCYLKDFADSLESFFFFLNKIKVKSEFCMSVRDQAGICFSSLQEYAWINLDPFSNGSVAKLVGCYTWKKKWVPAAEGLFGDRGGIVNSSAIADQTWAKRNLVPRFPMMIDYTSRLSFKKW